MKARKRPRNTLTTQSLFVQAVVKDRRQVARATLVHATKRQRLLRKAARAALQTELRSSVHLKD